jgi:hypothetical protein
VWIPLFLLPVAFINFPPFPRHYYMALSGLGVLLASILPNTRVMAYVAAILGVVTVTNVAMIDGGTALDQLLNKNISFRFRLHGQALQMDSLLSNAVNVVVPGSGVFHNAQETGRFPQLHASRLCDPISRFTSSIEGCAVFFRGYALENIDKSVVETPDGMPIFELNNEIVTLSRTTVFLNGRSPIQFNANLRTARESADNVDLEIYRAFNGTVDRLYQRHVAPGEQVQLRQNFKVFPESMFVLRVGPGPNGNENGDWLIWDAASP